VISECCGAENQVINLDKGVDFQDLGICPDCREHCEWVEEEE